LPDETVLLGGHFRSSKGYRIDGGPSNVPDFWGRQAAACH
jgi:hypothetical protein